MPRTLGGPRAQATGSHRQGPKACEPRSHVMCLPPRNRASQAGMFNRRGARRNEFGFHCQRCDSTVLPGELCFLGGVDGLEGWVLPR